MLRAKPPRWLMCRQRRPSAKLRLYCFPHSGGSPGEYLRWSDLLPTDIEVWGVQLPGRGSRLHEPPLTGIPELVEELVDQTEFLAPHAFFGHSMGALLAYETAQVLRGRHRAEPLQLFLSVNAPPHLHRPGLSLSDLSEPDFVARVEDRYGPLPPGLADDPVLRDRYLATLYADLTAVAGYRPVPQAPLDCPVLALGGTRDWESEDRLAEWRHHTTSRCEVRILPGGHFYFRDRPDAFFSTLSDCLTQLTHGLADVRSTNP